MDDPTDSLLIVSSHLGIIKILLINSHDNKAFDYAPGIWWRTIRFSDQDIVISVESDVSRARPVVVTPVFTLQLSGD